MSRVVQSSCWIATVSVAAFFGTFQQVQVEASFLISLLSIVLWQNIRARVHLLWARCRTFQHAQIEASFLISLLSVVF